MIRYLIIIEKAQGNYSTFSPDLPGRVATGRTRATAEKNMRKAIEMHVRASGMIISPSPNLDRSPNT